MVPVVPQSGVGKNFKRANQNLQRRRTSETSRNQYYRSELHIEDQLVNTYQEVLYFLKII